MTVTVDPDALIVDLPLDRIERTGPSVEARTVEAGLDLWIDELAALVPAGSLDGYGSPIWAALGDSFVRNELARERGEEPSTDPFAFVRVVDVGGRRVVENARASWEPPAHEPMLGPPYWDDVPAPWEVDAAIGPGTGIVIVEMQPDGPPIIRRLEAEHQDPELEGRLPIASARRVVVGGELLSGSRDAPSPSRAAGAGCRPEGDERGIRDPRDRPGRGHGNAAPGAGRSGRRPGPRVQHDGARLQAGTVEADRIAGMDLLVTRGPVRWRGPLRRHGHRGWVRRDPRRPAPGG